MRLVDREQGDLGAAEQGEAARRQQPLRRDIEQIEIAGEQPRLDRGGLLAGQRGIQHRRLDAGLEQARDLVAHQRDQRRDHDAAALAQQRRQLVAQRLAAAGRHQHQAIAAVGDMADDLFLRAAKAGQAEHGIQHRKRVGTVSVRRAGGVMAQVTHRHPSAPHAAHAGADVDARALARGARRGARCGKRPGRLLEQAEQAIRE